MPTKTEVLVTKFLCDSCGTTHDARDHIELCQLCHASDICKNCLLSISNPLILFFEGDNLSGKLQVAANLFGTAPQKVLICRKCFARVVSSLNRTMCREDVGIVLDDIREEFRGDSCKKRIETWR